MRTKPKKALQTLPKTPYWLGLLKKTKYSQEINANRKILENSG